ncbi:MAG: hypothetical protein ABFD46_06210 [Armatimonadota bacterium]
MITFVEENTDPRNPLGLLNDALFIGDDMLSYKHNGVGTVAYLDGHVGKIRGNNVTAFKGKDSKGKLIFYNTGLLNNL